MADATQLLDDPFDLSFDGGPEEESAAVRAAKAIVVAYLDLSRPTDDDQETTPTETHALHIGRNIIGRASKEGEGADAAEEDDGDEDGPVHRVRLDQAYALQEEATLPYTTDDTEKPFVRAISDDLYGSAGSVGRADSTPASPGAAAPAAGDATQAYGGDNVPQAGDARGTPTQAYPASPGGADDDQEEKDADAAAEAAETQIYAASEVAEPTLAYPSSPTLSPSPSPSKRKASSVANAPGSGEDKEPSPASPAAAPATKPSSPSPVAEATLAYPQPDEEGAEEADGDNKAAPPSPPSVVLSASLSDVGPGASHSTPPPVSLVDSTLTLELAPSAPATPTPDAKRSGSSEEGAPAAADETLSYLAASHTEASPVPNLASPQPMTETPGPDAADAPSASPPDASPAASPAVAASPAAVDSPAVAIIRRALLAQEERLKKSLKKAAEKVRRDAERAIKAQQAKEEKEAKKAAAAAAAATSDASVEEPSSMAAPSSVEEVPAIPESPPAVTSSSKRASSRAAAAARREAIKEQKAAEAVADAADAEKEVTPTADRQEPASAEAAVSEQPPAVPVPQPPSATRSKSSAASRRRGARSASQVEEEPTPSVSSAAAGSSKSARIQLFERAANRLATLLTSSDETVIDICAGGAGPFTHALLSPTSEGAASSPTSRHHAAKVIAFDKDPAAVDQLRLALEKIPGINDRWEVREEDVTNLPPQRLIAFAAHRVIVGVPLTETVFSAALRMLRSDGGVLHIHAFLTTPIASDAFLRAAIFQHQKKVQRHLEADLLDIYGSGHRWTAEIEKTTAIKLKLSKKSLVILDVRCAPTGPASLTLSRGSSQTPVGSDDRIHTIARPTPDEFEASLGANEPVPVHFREFNLGSASDELKSKLLQFNSAVDPSDCVDVFRSTSKNSSDTLDCDQLRLRPKISVPLRSLCNSVLQPIATEISELKTESSPTVNEFFYVWSTRLPRLTSRFEALLPATTRTLALSSALSIMSKDTQLQRCGLTSDPDDSLLIQIHGEKTVTLFRPQTEDSKQVTLKPGEVLYIPPGWRYDLTANTPSVSVVLGWNRQRQLPPVQRLFFYEFLAQRRCHGLVRLLALLDAIYFAHGKTTKESHQKLFFQQLREEHPLLFDDPIASVSSNLNEPAVDASLRTLLVTHTNDHSSCCAETDIKELFRVQADLEWSERLQSLMRVRQVVVQKYATSFVLHERFAKYQRIHAALLKRSDDDAIPRLQGPQVCGAYITFTNQMRATVEAVNALEENKLLLSSKVLAETRRGLLVRMMTSWEAFLPDLLGELADLLKTFLPDEELASRWPKRSLKLIVTNRLQAQLSAEPEKNVNLLKGEIINLLISKEKAPEELRAALNQTIQEAVASCKEPHLLGDNGFMHGLAALCGLQAHEDADSLKAIQRAKDEVSKLIKQNKESQSLLEEKLKTNADSPRTLKTLRQEQEKKKLSFESKHKELQAKVQGAKESHVKLNAEWPCFVDPHSGLALASLTSAPVPIVTFELKAPSDGPGKPAHVRLTSDQLCHDLVRLFYGTRCVFAHGKHERTVSGALKGLKDAFGKKNVHGLDESVRDYLSKLATDVIDRGSKHELEHNTLVNMQRLLRQVSFLCVQQAQRACQMAFDLVFWQEAKLRVRAASDGQQRKRV